MSAFLFILIINMLGSSARGAQGMVVPHPVAGGAGAQQVGAAAAPHPFAVVHVAYADDDTIFGTCTATVQADADLRVADTNALGLSVNSGKTTLLIMDHGNRAIAGAAREGGAIRVNGAEISPVPSVRLLGITLRQTWRWVDFVSDRAASTGRTVSGWFLLLRDRRIPIWVRRQVVMEYVNGVALFGAELWGGHPASEYVLLQAHLDKAIALLVGLRDWPKAGFAPHALRWELQLLPVDVIADATKLRAHLRYKDPDTVCGQIRAAASTAPPAPGCWTQVGTARYARALGPAWEDIPPHRAAEVALDYRNRAMWAWLTNAKSSTAQRYVSSSWHASRGYVELADRPQWQADACAITTLTSLRCQMLFSTIALAGNRKLAPDRQAQAPYRTTCPMCNSSWARPHDMAGAPASWRSAYGQWASHLLTCEPMHSVDRHDGDDFHARALASVAWRTSACTALAVALPVGSDPATPMGERLAAAAHYRPWAIARVLLGGTLAPPPPSGQGGAGSGGESEEDDAAEMVAAVTTVINDVVVLAPDALQRRWLGSDFSIAPKPAAAGGILAPVPEPLDVPPFIAIARFLQTWMPLLNRVSREPPGGLIGTDDE